MANNNTIVLRKHKLKHLLPIIVDSQLFQSRFSSSCSMNNCTANCCQYGVWVDVAERDKILANAELIQRHMEPHQEKNPTHWFEPREANDADFPSGRVTGTQVRDTGCVFLDSRGRCVLQKAATDEGLDKFLLKPFFCVAYPITIEKGVLMVDDEEFPDNTQCCTPISGGELSVFDVCAEELEFTLGQEGFSELRLYADNDKQ